MKSNDEVLNVVFNRFPSHKNLINELYEESESFRVLCKDYFDCRIMVDESTKISNKTSVLCKEYQILLAEIEDEVLERISI